MNMESGIRGVFTLMLAMVFAPGAAWSHGGEDHGAEPSAPPPAAAESGVAFAQSELFQLVIKYPPAYSSDPVRLQLLLADYATNHPVSGAVIQLQFTNPEGLTAEATATDSAGIYEATITLEEPGSFALLAIVTAGDSIDLLPIDGIEIAVPEESEAGDDGAHGDGIPQWILGAGAGGLALLTFLFGLAVGRRREPLVEEAEDDNDAS
jgi:hypothetical protein